MTFSFSARLYSMITGQLLSSRPRVSIRPPCVFPVTYSVAKNSPDDPPQKVGAFSEHQFWVTPYNENERYAAGVYPICSKGNDGLAVWTQANPPISNTDIVGWYTL